MQDGSPTPAVRSRGRPRDPLLESRVYQVASKVYGEQGWAGFNFDLIARESGVGKASLYNRWGSRAQLLRDLVEQRWRPLAAIDSGSLEADLQAFALLVLKMYLDTGGRMPLHLRRDIASYPEVAEVVGPALLDLSQRCLAIIRRAKARGEVDEALDTGLIPEMITATLEVQASNIGLQSRSSAIGADGALNEAVRARVNMMVDIIIRGALRPDRATPR